MLHSDVWLSLLGACSPTEDVLLLLSVPAVFKATFLLGYISKRRKAYMVNYMGIFTSSSSIERVLWSQIYISESDLLMYFIIKHYANACNVSLRHSEDSKVKWMLVTEVCNIKLGQNK